MWTLYYRPNDYIRLSIHGLKMTKAKKNYYVLKIEAQNQ